MGEDSIMQPRTSAQGSVCNVDSGRRNLMHAADATDNGDVDDPPRSGITFAVVLFEAWTMRVALPIYNGRISPVLDSARTLMVVDDSRGREVARSTVSLETTTSQRRAADLRRLKVDVVICGAVSRPLRAALSAAGVTVIPLRRGPIEEVLAAFVAGSLGDARFRLPGCWVPSTRYPAQPVRNAG